jgi:EAL domain-containing protein (putative c-di-GMP-specific phosphodiesterase class I)
MINIELLLAHFEEWSGSAHGGDQQLKFDEHGVCGCFRGLRLYSAYQPLVRADDGRTISYEALLRARKANGDNVSPADAFAVPDTPAAIIHFDRLCRMVHTVNFVHFGGRQGDLFLNVDFRHVLSIEAGDHGRAFEKLLRQFGLSSAQIVIEVIESRIDDLDLLEEAIVAYRKRGFRVAIDDFGAQQSNFDRLWRLSPDIVKIDRSLVVEASRNPRARRVLPKIVDIIHELGASVVCEGIETSLQDALARDSGADLLQGFLYGKPSLVAVIPPPPTFANSVVPPPRQHENWRADGLSANPRTTA